jgi:alcohol dehydrogenase class IV
MLEGLMMNSMTPPAQDDTSTLLAPQDWTFPVPIAYGPGRLAEIADMCRAAGMMCPLIVTDRGSRDLPFIAKLETLLEQAGLKSGMFSEISPNPRDTEVLAGCAAYRAGGHDGIIAIGGGSGMDGAKAICLTARTGHDLWDFEFEQVPPSLGAGQDILPLITIPTTAGTGAETEGTAMVTHTGKGMKFCVWHPDFHPVQVLLDPELTIGLPANLTAWTGADALTHAIEAYIVPGFHPLCDGAALEGLRLVAKWLPVAVEEPDNMTARGAMLVGSCLAGIAFLKGLGMVHAISHMVGAEFDTQHGLTNAVLLPAVLRENLSVLGDKATRMAMAMDLEDTSHEGLARAVEALLDRINIPNGLADLGVPADCAARIAEKAMQDSAATTDPGDWTAQRAEALINRAMTAAR